MKEGSIYRRLLIHRLDVFISDTGKACRNEHHSPLFDILRVSLLFGMMEMVVRMAKGTHFYSKTMWKNEVWKNAWAIDNEDWRNTSSMFSDTYYIRMTVESTEKCLSWWDLSNQHPEHIRMCENMARLVTRCSYLKSDSIEYKGTNLSVRSCANCDMFQCEDLEHVVLRCPFHNKARGDMYQEINELESKYDIKVIEPGNLMLNLIGRSIAGVDIGIMHEIWTIAGSAIDGMYKDVIRSREETGVG